MKSIVRFVKQHLRIAPVTMSMLAALIGVYLVQIAVDNRSIESPFHGSFLAQWGANVSGLTTSGEWWRLLTSMFLHGGLLHIVFNSSALLELGRELEPRLGSLRYSILYVFAGLGGAVASMVWHVNVLSVGASGAIFGLFGAAWVLAWKQPQLFPRLDAKRILTLILFSLGLGWIFDFDNAAHIGGLVAGGIASLGLAEPTDGGTRRWHNPGFAIALSVLAMIYGAIGYYTYRPDQAVKIEAAHLADALDMSLSSERSVLSACAYRQLENFDGNDGSLEQRLRSCATQPRTQHMLKIWVNNQWPRCIAASRRLIRRLDNEQQRKAVRVAHDYCDAERDLDRMMLGKRVDEAREEELKASIDQFSWMVSGLDYYRQGAVPTNADRLGYALFQLLKQPNAETRRLAALDSCPQPTCYRDWLQNLIAR